MYGDKEFKITVSQDKDAMDRYILPMAFLVDDKLLTLDLHGYGLSQYGFMFDESSLTFIDTEYIMSGLCNLYLQSTSPFIYFYQFLCSKKIKIYIYIIYPSEPPNPSLKKRQAIFKF